MLLVAIIMAGVIIFDQLTKWLARQFLAGTELIPNYFSIELLANKGIAFGITIPELIFYPLVVIFLAIIIIKYKKLVALRRNRAIQLAIGFVIGGALSNIIDRLVFGHVIDFISIINLSYFNFADLFIITGVAVLAWKEFTSPEAKKT